jgi:CDP-diacylglycerol--serine O-phosphatidyltransferase
MTQQPLKKKPVTGLRWWIPNLCTLFGLCTGISALFFALQSRFHAALLMVVLATFIDALDGRIARALGSTSQFGAELDSLSDFVNFGVTPAILLYIYLLQPLGFYGWISVCFVACCCAYRLARFNAALLEPQHAYTVPRGYFTGVPAPAGAVLALLPMVVHLNLSHAVKVTPEAAVVYELLVGLLMVSRIPTISVKDVGFTPLPMMMLATMLTLLVLFPWWTITAVSVSYLAFIPFGYVHAYYFTAPDTSDKQE